MPGDNQTFYAFISKLLVKYCAEQDFVLKLRHVSQIAFSSERVSDATFYSKMHTTTMRIFLHDVKKFPSIANELSHKQIISSLSCFLRKIKST